MTAIFVIDYYLIYTENECLIDNRPSTVRPPLPRPTQPPSTTRIPPPQTPASYQPPPPSPQPSWVKNHIDHHERYSRFIF